jgi:hypothetical protein
MAGVDALMLKTLAGIYSVSIQEGGAFFGFKSK